MDKRRQHRALLKAVADGTAAFVFYSRKLRDDALSLGYIGQSNFLKQYGHRRQVENVLRKRLELCERLMVAQPTNIRFLDIAVCLFDMTKVGADSVSELERLRDGLSADAIGYILRAIVHMSDVAKCRQAARDGEAS